ncbi:hypothetical protein RLOC_00008861 [Lonchura striata]|uniref:SMB domain-containing protein n=1 Tax=Lonchura striata TaxID=40157 RepID=A0A218V2H1_9PASE|nr:hypothetical protein RLOC_00008861 [Lonchura striata domestica]
MRGPLLWAGWLLATGCLVGATGSCRQRCCPGRNNACWAPGARRARCYCDSYCQRTGDCCQDYLTSCRRAEVAKVLPNSFSQDFRDPWRRAGLPLPEEPSGSPFPGYCGYFRLTQVGAPCRGRAWSRRLQRDKQFSLIFPSRTFWVAASVVGCQGSWVQESLQEGCVCSPPALIFV